MTSSIELQASEQTLKFSGLYKAKEGEKIFKGLLKQCVDRCKTAQESLIPLEDRDAEITAQTYGQIMAALGQARKYFGLIDSTLGHHSGVSTTFDDHAAKAHVEASAIVVDVEKRVAVLLEPFRCPST